MPFRQMRRPEPVADGRRRRAGWYVATVWLLALGGCGQPPAAPSPPGPAEYPEFITYEGLVFEPHGNGRYWGPEGVTGVPGFRVTIIGGQPDGWTTETDAEGRFYFEDYPFCPLHTAECLSRRFRVEKAGYQTREVGASDGYLWELEPPATGTGARTRSASTSAGSGRRTRRSSGCCGSCRP